MYVNCITAGYLRQLKIASACNITDICEVVMFSSYRVIFQHPAPKPFQGGIYRADDRLHDGDWDHYHDCPIA